MPTENPTMMEVIRESLTTNHSNNFRFTPDNTDPKKGVLSFKVGNTSHTADMSIKGDSTVVIKFNDINQTLKQVDIKNVHDKVMGVFGQKGLNVDHPNFRSAANYNLPVETRVEPAQLEAAQAKVIKQRAQVADTVSIIRDHVNMTNNGIAVAEAQTNHALGQTLGLAPQHDPMKGRAPESPIMQQAREAQAEWDRLMGRGSSPKPKPTSPSYGPIIIPDANVGNAALPPEAAELFQRPLNTHNSEAATASHSSTPHHESNRLKGLGRGAGVLGTLLAAAGASQAAPSGKKLEAVIDTAPGVEQARKGNLVGAAVQVIGSFDPLMGFGEAALNRVARAAGADVPKSMLEEVADKRVAIPQKALNENIRMARVAEGTLNDVGLMGPDKNGKTGADYLRNPETRDAYLGALKEAFKMAKDPKIQEAIGAQVKVAEKFCEIEERRLAKMEPHTKGMDEKMAANLKVQHLAAQFKQENKVPDLRMAEAHSAPPQNVTKVAQAPGISTAAQRG